MDNLNEEVPIISVSLVTKDDASLAAAPKDEAQSSKNGTDSNAQNGEPWVSVQPVEGYEQIEDMEKYDIGGFHPIHIGDELDNGNYHIVHKLGYGGLSTVWLARDRKDSRFVAIKIMIAVAAGAAKLKELEIRQHLDRDSTPHPARSRLCFLLDSFETTGPNGTHTCLVYPFTGLSIGQLFVQDNRLRGCAVRRIARQLTETVANLHSHGICHGDLTTNNLTLKLANFDEWTEEDVQKRFGRPKIEYLKTYHDEPVPKRLPKYVVQPLDLTRIDPVYHTEELCVIDFGGAFFVQDPPKMLGTPGPYRSPSDWFGEIPGKGSDLWALACAFFCMRASIDLFDDLLVSPGPIGSIKWMMRLLGPLPDRWDRLYFDVYGVARSRSDIDAKLIKQYRNEGIDYRLKPWSRQPAEFTPQDIGPRIVDSYHSPPREVDIERAKKDPDWKPRYAQIEIPEKEAHALGDLFAKLLCYEPEERTPANMLIDHAWFTNEFPDNPCAEGSSPLFQMNYPPYRKWDEL